MSKVFLNRGEIVGFLGNDAETAYTKSGAAITTITVAVTKPENTETKRPAETTWFKCVIWGKLGETLRQYLKKGVQVYFSGEMCIKSWQDKEGKKVTGFELSCYNHMAHHIIIMSSPGSRPAKSESNEQSKPEQGTVDDNDPELPFNK